MKKPKMTALTYFLRKFLKLRPKQEQNGEELKIYVDGKPIVNATEVEIPPPLNDGSRFVIYPEEMKKATLRAKNLKKFE